LRNTTLNASGGGVKRREEKGGRGEKKRKENFRFGRLPGKGVCPVNERGGPGFSKSSASGKLLILGGAFQGADLARGRERRTPRKGEEDGTEWEGGGSGPKYVLV